MPENNHPSNGNVIDVSNLGYHYPGSVEPSLRGINLAIPRGRCFGLLGPNGAGKTTLLSILTGMLPVQEGVVTINGSAPSRSMEIKRISAIVPQELAFYPGLSGRENLECFAGFHGMAGDSRNRAVDRAIESCQLAEVAHKRAATYSGGLKRRLNLAIGLLNEPAILYLDEPTVGIDAQSRNFILEAIRSLKTAGVTVVYTSHYMEEVQMLCDDIAIVDQGRVVLQSSLADLLETQGHVLDVRFDVAPTEAQLQKLSEFGGWQLQGRHLKLRLDSRETKLLDVAQLFEALGLAATQVNFGISRLEDIYLSITKYELRD